MATTKAESKLSPPDKVRDLIETGRVARLNAGGKRVELADVLNGLAKLDKAYEKEHDDELLGVPGADKRAAKLLAERDGKRMHAVQLTADIDRLTKIVRDSQERIARVQANNPVPFHEEIERTSIPPFLEVREALIPLLEEYLAAWDEPATRYRVLGSATAAFVAQRERGEGFIRDDRVIHRDSQPPACPITPALIERLRTAAPRPPALEPGYDPLGLKAESTTRLVYDEVGE